MAKHLAQYNTARHAGLAPRYQATHIVEESVPLPEVTFAPEDDEMAPYRGPRRADTCPKLDSLDAVASNPQIQGLEERQHLTITCPERAQVISTDQATSYGVCVLKAAANAIDLNQVPDQLLTDPQSSLDVHCPFEYLGGRVVVENIEVPVAVDVQQPYGQDYRAL